jgi:hypothetical protein
MRRRRLGRNRREVLMSNQVVIPFPQRSRQELPSVPSTARELRRAKILSRLSTARDVVRAVIDTLSYMGEARVRPPLGPDTK